MLDIIILVFLVIHVGNKAKRKGLSVLKWRILLVAAWLGGEILGIILGVMMLGFNKETFLNLMVIGLAGAVGGYLLIKYNLDKYPDKIDNDIDQIGR